MRCALILVLAFAATAAPARPTHLQGRCNAGHAQQFLGRFGSPEIAAQARDAAGARVVRWLWPGTVVTMEYDPGRLDIELNPQRIIHAFRCG